MSLRNEQCMKVCRILDDVLANRPTERDALIVAVRTAFDELEERKTGKWQLVSADRYIYRCDVCEKNTFGMSDWCPNCGAKMEGR